MNRRTGELLLWSTTAVVLCAALASGLRERSRLHALANPQLDIPAVGRARLPGPDSLAHAAFEAVDADLFQPDRRPQRSPAPASPPQENVPSPQLPSDLALRGILGGPPWNAVLAGVPGRPSDVVVGVGDTIAGMRVTRIGLHSIVLSSADTLWTLTLGGR